MADAHSKRSHNFKDLTGQRFGRLAAESFEGRKGPKSFWRCRCDCGTIKPVAAQHLTSGMVQSCGCLRRETTARNAAEMHTTHGTSKGATAVAYRRWSGMMQRCYAPTNHAFRRYGGRGIFVCDRWHDPRNFVADMGLPPPGMTLERIDNDGPYSPENCRWATYREQNNNRRSTRKLTHNGETLSAAAWAARLGIHKQTFYGWLRQGKTLAELVG